MAAFVTVAAACLFAGCGPVGATGGSSSANNKMIAVGAENEYADVISQIGGQYVSVSSIISNPSTDPHTYEADTSDAIVVGKAALLVENGLGYDDFMEKLASATPNAGRTTINAARALGYGANTRNPHLWYQPQTMMKVAALIANDLEKRLPAHKACFEENLARFNRSLEPWTEELAALKKDHAGEGVAVTEPVSDYLLEVAGLDNKTPWAYQAAVMNGTDPSPQDVQTQRGLFSGGKIKVFLYNCQAEDDSTKDLLSLADTNKIPVVGIYETMPTGYTYQKWMGTETLAVRKAIEKGVSTKELQ